MTKFAWRIPLFALLLGTSECPASCWDAFEQIRPLLPSEVDAALAAPQLDCAALCRLEDRYAQADVQCVLYDVADGQGATMTVAHCLVPKGCM